MNELTNLKSPVIPRRPISLRINYDDRSVTTLILVNERRLGHGQRIDALYGVPRTDLRGGHIERFGVLKSTPRVLVTELCVNGRLTIQNINVTTVTGIAANMSDWPS